MLVGLGTKRTWHQIFTLRWNWGLNSKIHDFDGFLRIGPQFNFVLSMQRDAWKTEGARLLFIVEDDDEVDNIREKVVKRALEPLQMPRVCSKWAKESGLSELKS